eukprot:CAMPEP_0168327864 /NCGR_PEP_ID=MMETSP0213-20121227/6133_1 /TAXON_ID=151035 /ORGANISM="Euplotes harpa, Strain FSP1.4" /LENGTH=137 /DNA_ID=CAMNT_0008330813 /DNA_START=22 /DNA_END=436 /DNA_ORIENTATION=-
MAKLTSWADFFKFTTDVIDEDYHHNKKDEAQERREVFSRKKFGLAKLGEHFEGWTYSLTGNFTAGSTLDKSTFASALKVKRSNLDAKVTYDHSKKTDLEAEVAYHPEEQSKVIVGGNVSLNLKDAKVNKHTFGVKHA